MTYFSCRTSPEKMKGNLAFRAVHVKDKRTTSITSKAAYVILRSAQPYSRLRFSDATLHHRGKNLLCNIWRIQDFLEKVKASFYGKSHDPFAISAPTYARSKLKFGDCIEINMYMLMSTLQWSPWPHALTRAIVMLSNFYPGISIQKSLQPFIAWGGCFDKWNTYVP